jgi:lysophospholipase L1-like esterase
MGKSIKALLIFASILAGCAFIIVVIEARFKLSSSCQLSGIIHDEQLGWRLKRSHGWHHNNPNSRKVDGMVTINSSGFRDKEHSSTKEPDRKRIMFIGDSYTAGLEYSDGEVFTSLFDHMLNEKIAHKNTFDIMNVAVPAWATDQQYLYLKNEGMQYLPDYVFLMIAPNDIRETYGKQFLSLRSGHLEQNRPPSIPWRARLYWSLANYSCAFQYWQSKWKQDYGSFANIFQYFPVSFPAGSEMCSDKHLFLREVPPEVRKAKELFKAILLEINRLCKENHCKFLVSIIPTKIEYDGTLKEKQYQPGGIADYVENVAAENDIPFLNLVHALNAEEKDPLKIFISDEYHLNDYGHAFVAKKLLPFFIANQ